MSVLVPIVILLAACVTADVRDPLYLTPLIKNNSNIARELSKVDHDLFQGIRSYSGFITVNKEYNSNLFFWYFPHKDPTVPWIIWLNGGPGASSLMGLFDLIGPFKIVDGKVEKRNVTWTSEYSLLFIDNPVGAGFSFTDDVRGYTSNEDQVSEQLFECVLQFLEMFPELRRAPLFLAGQSYAGKYVPALAIRIHRHSDSPSPVNLKGILMGNPMIDPENMMHYTELVRVLGFLGDKHLEELSMLEKAMVRLIHEGKMVDAANKFNETIEYIKLNSGVSIYNFLKEPTYIQSSLEDFVTQDEVRSAIHVGKASFNLNNQVVYHNMLPDIANTSRPLVEELLTSSLYGVLCYSGQLDLILPYSNSKHVYDKLQWPRRQEYVVSNRTRIMHHSDTDTVVAYKKSGGNFAEILIRNGGHCVPQDQPEVFQYIARDFINMYKNTPKTYTRDPEFPDFNSLP